VAKKLVINGKHGHLQLFSTDTNKTPESPPELNLLTLILRASCHFPLLKINSISLLVAVSREL